MVRFVIIGIVVAVAFTLYALVDAAMTDSSRARGVGKPVWVVLVVVLPVLGGVLWFTIGKGATPPPQPVAPDDDPRFTGTRMSNEDLESHMRDLEEQLRALDDEVYPGEQRGDQAQPVSGHGSAAGSEPDETGDGEPAGPQNTGERTGRPDPADREEQPGSDDSGSPQR